MRSSQTLKRVSRPAEKIFVSNEGLATITCPQCGVTKQVPVDRFCGKQHTLKVNCRCGVAFSVHLEFRRMYRKRTELQGTYRILSSGGGGGPVAIQDISRNGVGFTVSGMHNVKVGQKALIDFVLDNRKQTRLQKEVVIKSVHINRVGCEFTDQQAFEKDLGFYLRP